MENEFGVPRLPELSDNAQKDLIRTQLISDRRTRFLADWTDRLKKSADIVDNRDMFYR